MARVPVTEAPNVITENIDLADSEGIVRLLRQCDAQIFSGWEQYESIYDEATTNCIRNVAAHLKRILLGGEDACVVLSGCGTSGRLAFVVARSFNRLLESEGKPGCVHYCIAGGDKALLQSIEAPEDSWLEGKQALEEASQGKSQVLVIGISCGLSAPYVAGQLWHCIEHPEKFTAVLLGFNPNHLARKNIITNWDKSFLDVVTQMSKQDNCLILNPVVGPEPITGSTRMKSGTATKMLLEVACLSALTVTRNSDLSSHGIISIVDLLRAYEVSYRQTYLSLKHIAQLVSLAGNTLRAGGRMCYLGTGTLGLMAIIDASECPPTYGSDYEDVRGFLPDGWKGFGNYEGELTQVGAHFHLSWDEFEEEVLPLLSGRDTVVLVLGDTDPREARLKAIMEKLQQKGCSMGVVHCTASQATPPEWVSGLAVASICLPVHILRPLLAPVLPPMLIGVFLGWLCEVSLKWVLNAITTGGHVLKGKVLKNRMIDLQVSNVKLYYRAIGIVERFAGTSKELAEEKLLEAIYDTEQPLLQTKGTPGSVTGHIQQATGKAMVVPLAILLAKGKHRLISAKTALDQCPVVRKVIQEE